jgi:hypothetical protein
MKRMMSSRKGLFVFFFSIAFIAGVLLTTILLLADNPPRGICSKRFSLATWNVGDPPWEFPVPQDVSHPTLNYWMIWWIKGNSFEDNITGLQEDFQMHMYDGARENYKYGIAFERFYEQLYANGKNCGLALLSQFFIGRPYFEEWEVYNGWDTWASKGVAFSEILIPVTNSSGWTCLFPIHVYTLHAQSGDTMWDHFDRMWQLGQVSRLMHARSSGYSVIVAGDFNINSFNPPSLNYVNPPETKSVSRKRADTDPSGGTGLNYEFGGVGSEDIRLLNSFMAEHNLTMANNPTQYTHESVQTLDYILFRTGDYRESLQLLDCNVRYDAQGSDHYPVKAYFNFSVNYDAFPDLVVSDISQLTYDRFAEEGYVSVSVKNNGPGPTDRASQVQVTLSVININPLQNKGDQQTEEDPYKLVYEGYGTIPQLNSGQSAVAVVYMPGLFLGRYFPFVKMSATANSPASIREIDEHNNNLEKQVYVKYH